MTSSSTSCPMLLNRKFTIDIKSSHLLLFSPVFIFTSVTMVIRIHIIVCT